MSDWKEECEKDIQESFASEPPPDENDLYGWKRRSGNWQAAWAGAFTRAAELQSALDAANARADDAESALSQIFSTLLPVTNTARSTTVSMAEKAVRMLHETRADIQAANARAERADYDVGYEMEKRQWAERERDAALAQVAVLREALGNIDSYVQHLGQDIEGEWIHTRAKAAVHSTADAAAAFVAGVRREALEDFEKVLRSPQFNSMDNWTQGYVEDFLSALARDGKPASG